MFTLPFTLYRSLAHPTRIAGAPPAFLISAALRPYAEGAHGAKAGRDARTLQGAEQAGRRVHATAANAGCKAVARAGLAPLPHPGSNRSSRKCFEHASRKAGQR